MNPNGSQDGNAIRRYREERHLSVTALAARIGIRRQSLSNIELGTKPASAAVLVKIARELKVPLDEIVKEPEDADAVAA